MPFGAATPSAHPPYDSRPVELELRMATASAGRRRRRPLETAAVFVVQLVLPLSQRPFARGGYPYPRSDAVSLCVVPVCDATLHPRLMVPSKTASMRRAALPVAARGRPQAARRHRVAAAWCLPHVVRCRWSVVRCNRRRSSVASCARSLLQALVGASGSSGTVAPYFATCASSTLVATRLRHRRNVRRSAVVATCPSGVIRRTDQRHKRSDAV
jgi:hypothetical protein